MNYTEIKVERVVKWSKFQHKSMKFRVYESHIDGPWVGSGNLLDVYEVDDNFVCINVGYRPVMVLPNDIKLLIRRLKVVTGCQNIVGP